MKKGRRANIFGKSNPYTIININLWCQLNDKSFNLLPNQKWNNNRTFLKWECLKENCREIFKSSWNDISQGRGCPFCHGKQVGLSNCLVTKNPELAKEWHPTKNGDLTPYDVTCGSDKNVWWVCSNNHIWNAKVATRSKCGCPYCASKFPTKDYNLYVINPKLCEEWNYVKNKNKPFEYLPNSGKKVWWKCKECGHEWEAAIDSRNGTNKSGCPECNKSKGEKKIKDFLDLNNIYYTPQQEFNGLVGLGGGNLSYDFYLPQYNLLIEYQGEQHKRYVKGFHQSKKDFQKQQEHDMRKKEYAQNNNIKLLEIWYYDFDNIEKILSIELKNIKTNR